MLTTILLILALVCFIWAAAGNAGVPIQMGWLGLAFVSIVWMITKGGV